MAEYPVMISAEEAKQYIEDSIVSLKPVFLPIEISTGLVLAEPIYAPYSIPNYRQSSMDGFALDIEELKEILPIMGEIPAGTQEPFHLPQGKTVKIFTGAAVPDEANVVVMIEKCEIINETLIILDDKLRFGDNIRPIGSEILEGALAMESGMSITPAAVGFLAGIGIDKVKVIPTPKIKIIITGNEIQEPGTVLTYGKTFNANTYLLKAAFSQLGIHHVETDIIEDNLHAIQQELDFSLSYFDMVIVSGGVSVGDYDFTGLAFDNCRIKKVFHKIKQKPGKPILFGIKNSIPVFGLPGNPASVLTCFYEYILPALGKLMHRKMELQKLQVQLSNNYKKLAGLTHFVKAFYNGEFVSILTGQESYKLNTFARANGLVVLTESSTEFQAGDWVEFHLFPSF